MGDFVIFSYFFRRISRLEGLLHSVPPQGDLNFGVVCTVLCHEMRPIIGSAKTDPVRFKCGFGEGLLKDKFAFSDAYNSPIYT